MPTVNFQDWVQQIKSGAIGSFPTDTVPALTTLPQFADRIYEVKARSADKPLILMAAEIEDLWPYLDQSDLNAVEQWRSVMNQYFPGALTLVLPKSDRPELDKMNPTIAKTIGVRIPNHELARTLLRQTGPLATTSVNRSGEPALLEIGEIRSEFPELYTLNDEVLKGQMESLTKNQPSTVIQWTGDGWEILRWGAIVLI